jgi:hypothetical protein
MTIFLLALLPRITTLGGTFIANDENLYWTWTNEFTQAIVNFNWADTLVGRGYPSVTQFWIEDLGFLIRFIANTLQGYTPADFWQRAALDQSLVFDLLGQRRLAIAIANALLIWLIYLQARKLMGEAIAFLGATLLAFAPFLLADSRTMRGDALLSHLMLLSVLAFLLFLRHGRWGQLILSAVALGFAVLTKITAIPLTGWTVLAVGVYLLQRQDLTRSTRLRWAVLVLAVWGTIAALVVFTFWPALWVAPLTTFEFVRVFAASAVDGRTNYFWGRLTTDEPLPLFYPIAFLFRATPLMVLGVVVMAGLVIVTVWRWLVQSDALAQPQSGLSYFSPRRFASFSFEAWHMPASTRWTLLALGAYVLIFWIIINVGALKRDRYLLPVFPATIFLAAAGLLWLVRYIARRWPGNHLPTLLAHGRWVWAVFSLLLALELGHILSTHPFYSTYWSPLMGGGWGATNIMMAETGVESSALVELSQKPGAAHETVAVLYERDLAPAYIGKTVRLAVGEPWITANHVLLRQFHFQTEKLDQKLLDYLYRKPPEQVIEFQGYPWGWIYPGPAAQYYAGSLLDGKAELLGYNLSGETASPEQPLELKLFWRNKGYRPPEHIYVRLVDAAGFRWAETVAQPLPNFAPTANQPEAIVEAAGRLDIPPGTPPGLYFLKMGIASTADEPDVGEFALPSEGSKIAVARAKHHLALTFDRPFNQALSSDLTLLGVEIPPSFILTPQTPQTVSLYWRVNQNVPEDYTLALSLIDTTGREVAYWLGSPARGLYPSSNWQQGELIRDPWTLDLTTASRNTDSILPGRYTLRLTLFTEAGRAINQVYLGEIEVSDRYRLFELPPITHPLKVQLGQAISLLGYNLTQAPLTGGARFTLKLYWQATQPIPLDYTVFTQVLDANGGVVGQHDGLPAEGALPTTTWEVGEIIPDRHQIDFPVTPNEYYRLIVGMYDPRTHARLPITNAEGDTMGDFVLLYTLE